MALVLRNGHTNGDCSIEDVSVDHPLVELCLTSSKGLGLFAKADIPRGTRILAESPLMVLPNPSEQEPGDLWQRLKTLPQHQFDLFYSLQSNGDVLPCHMRRSVRKKIVASGDYGKRKDTLDAQIDVEMKTQAIAQTNATSISRDGHTVGIFPVSSRLNHGCRPNVHSNYNASLQQHTVHAIHDIKAGEELHTSYIDPSQPMEQRTYALEKHGVDCYCDVCQGSASFKAIDKRRKRLRDLNIAVRIYDGEKERNLPRIPEPVIPRNPTRAVAAIEESITLLTTEGLAGMPLASAYRRASKYSLQLGKIDQAKVYASRELEVEHCCLGDETEYMHDLESAQAWVGHVVYVAERDQVKFRMSEKRVKKELKKADKKAAKKCGKGRR